MNGILDMELKPAQSEETQPKSSQKELEEILKNSEERKLKTSSNDKDKMKNEDQIAHILEVILGDYLPSDFRPSLTLTKDSTEKAAIILEELLLERK